AIIDLGDAALAEGLAEPQKAAGALGNLHRQQGLALGTEIGAFGHVPQAIEVDIGATVDGYQMLAGGSATRNVALDAGDGQRTGRLEDRAGILEDILDGR